MPAFIKTPSIETLFKRAKVLRESNLHDAAHACEQLAYAKIKGSEVE